MTARILSSDIPPRNHWIVGPEYRTDFVEWGSGQDGMLRATPTRRRLTGRLRGEWPTLGRVIRIPVDREFRADGPNSVPIAIATESATDVNLMIHTDGTFEKMER